MHTLEKTSDSKELPSRIINKAIMTAHTSTQRFKLGAVVFKKNKILGAAPNEKRTHPIYGSGKYQCLHAEYNALRRAHLNGHDTEGCDIFVYRTNDNCSKPCTSCQSRFAEFGVRYVYYVDRNNKIERIWP